MFIQVIDPKQFPHLHLFFLTGIISGFFEENLFRVSVEKAALKSCVRSHFGFPDPMATVFVAVMCPSISIYSVLSTSDTPPPPKGELGRGKKAHVLKWEQI